MRISILLLLFILSCGGNAYREENNQLNSKLQALEATTTELNNLITSDFTSCPNSGETADPLIQKICNVAQASTQEARVELKSELVIFVQQLQSQIDAINNDLVSHRVDLDSLTLQVDGILNDLSDLEEDITSLNAAVLALQTLTSQITGTLAGNLIPIEVGEENPLAGPIYETVLRRNDRTRFNAYVEAFGSALSLPNNPVNATNGTSIVTITFNSHGLSVNDRIKLSDLEEGKGFTSGDLVGEFIILSTTTNTFNIQLRRNATANGSFGGNIGVAQKILGRGMGTLWSTGDPSDTVVRISNLGSKRYNFIIRRLTSNNTQAELCYDKTNNLALFSIINAAPESGSGNIVCH